MTSTNEVVSVVSLVLVVCVIVLACAGLISARLRKRRSDDELRRI